MNAMQVQKIYDGDNTKLKPVQMYEVVKTGLQSAIDDEKQGALKQAFYLSIAEHECTYKLDGYKKCAEWAETEYGFSPNTTRKYIRVADAFLRYSHGIDENGNETPPELRCTVDTDNETYSIGQLVELVNISVGAIKVLQKAGYITAQSTTKELRQVCKIVRTLPMNWLSDDNPEKTFAEKVKMLAIEQADKQEKKEDTSQPTHAQPAETQTQTQTKSPDDVTEAQTQPTEQPELTAKKSKSAKQEDSERLANYIQELVNKYDTKTVYDWLLPFVQSAENE